MPKNQSSSISSTSCSLFHVECTKAFPSTIRLLKAIRLVFRGYTIFFFSFLRRRGYFACATVVIIGFSRAHSQPQIFTSYITITKEK
jgi:hypothetical protein